MLSKFIRWLIDYKECDFKHCDCEKITFDRLSMEREHCENIHISWARSDDERFGKIKDKVDNISKRIDLFFKRQKCFLCGKTASDCEQSKNH